MVSKRAILLVLAWLLTNQFPCLSQTNFGISAGVDVAKMKAISNQGGFEILESGYGNKSIVGGFRIEQKLNNSFLLALRGLYTKKKAKEQYMQKFLIGNLGCSLS